MAERRRSQCPSGLTFFGLTTSNREAIFTQIHEIVFHGKGGYDWDTVYNMPIWLRKFTFTKIKEFYDEERKSYEKQNKQISKQMKKPFKSNPTYTTKASNK